MKALKACLQGNISSTFHLPAVKQMRRSASNPDGYEYGSFGYLVREGEFGYTCYTAHLGCNTWHLLALSDAPGFLPVLSEVALWNELRSPRFSTPMIRAWLPWIAEQLLADKDDDYETTQRIQLLDGWQSSAAVLVADTAGLDKLVSQGIREGRLVFPEEAN